VYNIPNSDDAKAASEAFHILKGGGVTDQTYSGSSMSVTCFCRMPVIVYFQSIFLQEDGWSDGWNE
jgi:hypothetical protein